MNGDGLELMPNLVKEGREDQGGHHTKTEGQISEEEDFNQFDLLFALDAQEEGLVQGQENILGMADMKVEDGGGCF